MKGKGGGRGGRIKQGSSQQEMCQGSGDCAVAAGCRQQCCAVLNRRRVVSLQIQFCDCFMSVSVQHTAFPSVA